MKEKYVYEKAIDNSFAFDVLSGLTAKNKFLSSKYLYNKRGDEIFQEIMAMPEYYLTRAEFEILASNKKEMLERFKRDVDKFALIEFGAGDGTKTKVLLEYFWQQDTRFTYHPIDISANIVEKLTIDLERNLPGLEVKGVPVDYFKLLDQFDEYFPAEKNTRKVIFFLGANIGNFTHEESVTFLTKIRSFLNEDDLLLIGMDLRKNPEMIYEAYHDKAGITQKFNLNLLQRINEELDADFDIRQFQFFPLYNPMEGTIKSYLVSKKEQDIYIRALRQIIHFDPWEAIYMEKSQKYSPKEIEQLAQASGFKVDHNFLDEKKCFTDTLWKVI